MVILTGKTRLFSLSILCIALTGAAYAQDAVQAWRRAQAHMTAGEPLQARGIYNDLLRAKPNHNVLLLARARASMAAGQAADAAADYAVLMQKFPNEPSLRREAADAMRLAGNLREAEELAVAPPVVDIRAVKLSTLLPPRPRERPQPRQPARHTFLSGSVRTGILYDSNANQGPASEMFHIGGMDVTVPGSARKSSMGAYLGANLDFLHRIGDNTPWAFVADARLFARANFNSDLLENQTREWQWGRVAAGIRYAQGQNFFEARLKTEIFDYQLTNNVLAIGPELTYIRALLPNLHWISQLSGDVRVFKRDHGRNGFFLQAGQYLRLFFAEGRHSLLFGGKYLGNFAKEKRPSYHGYELTARFNAGITDKLMLSPNVAFTQEQYRTPATVLDLRKRRDNRVRLGLDLIYQVNDRLSLEANYQYIKNDSRSKLYEYTQNVVGGGVAWSF